MPGPVEPVGERRTKELRALMAARWWQVAMLLVPIGVGVASAAAFSDASRPAVFALAAGAAVLAVAVATYLLANSRVKSAFLQAWSRSRGWTEGIGVWVDEATQLLREGDRRESSDHFCGPLPGGGQAALCHYTYEVRHESRDSEGRTTTSWESHDFTVIETLVSAPDFPRLTMHPRSFGDNRMFDRIDSALTTDRVVDLESSELERDYKLEVADSTSDTAVRLLFDPAFMVWCLDQAADDMMLELEGETLVIAIPGHSYDAAQLDGLVDRAANVVARLADVETKTPSMR